MLYLKLQILRLCREEQENLKKESKKLHSRISANKGSDRTWKKIRKNKADLEAIEKFCEKEWSECEKMLDNTDDVIREACKRYFNQANTIAGSVVDGIVKENFLRTIKRACKRNDNLELDKY